MQKKNVFSAGIFFIIINFVVSSIFDKPHILADYIDRNEADLILSLKKGSEKAFDSIYQIYAKRLYAYSLQFTKSPEESEEIVHDVFVKLWTDREKIRQEETLRSLLFIMTKNYLINAFRAKINQPAYEEYINYKGALFVNDTDHQLEYEDLVRKIRKAMESLSVTQQKVITLSKMEHLSNKEIAAKIALSEQTVKNQLSAGLKILKQKLGDSYLLFVLLYVNSFIM